MSFRYVSVEEAIEAERLRMVVVGGVPSPFGEAAKGIFHLKQGGLDKATSAALDPLLLAHRDRIYAQHLALPLSL